MIQERAPKNTPWPVSCAASVARSRRSAGDSRVGEEHRPEPADAHLEVLRREAVDLSVGLQVGDIAQSLPGAEPAGVLEHPRGKVDAQGASCRGRPAGVPGRLARPAADIEHPVAGTDTCCGAEPLIVRTRLGIEHLGVPDPALARRAIPLRGLRSVGARAHRPMCVLVIEVN
jgi:hypothetical protein